MRHEASEEPNPRARLDRSAASLGSPACRTHKLPLREGQQSGKLTQAHIERRNDKDLSLDNVNEE